MRRLGLRVAAGVLALVAGESSVRATAGFAEWEVYTPGGNLISHNDIWKAEHGTCLRSEARPDAGDATIFVSYLTRWRYYPGHVVGDHAGGHFIFDEAGGTVTRYADREGFDRAVAAARFGPALSAWLTPGDGWHEAWLPFFVWRPCRDASLPGTLSPAECEAALDPRKLALYKHTTWGRLCAEWRRQGPWDEGMGFLETFCEEIANAPEPGSSTR